MDESPWCGAVRRPRQNTQGTEGLFHPHAEDSLCKQRSRAAKVLSHLPPLQSLDAGACVPPEVHDAIAGYVSELPGIIHSRDATATDTTKAVAPYEDNELATVMLHSFPTKWKTQYDLGHKAPPNSEYLQNALEKIV
eukprot:scaffold75226_cov45-Cyclotella_meneghiniana.AAC.2